MDHSQHPTSRRAQEEEAEIRLGWRMAGLAFTMASEVAAGALLGWLVDHFAKTAPKGLLIGSIAGIAVGMWSFIRGGLEMNRMLAKQEPRRIKPLPFDDKEDADGSKDDDWSQ